MKINNEKCCKTGEERRNPLDCSPGQIKECHGDETPHPCSEEKTKKQSCCCNKMNE